jgi:single-strand DNA-binding protein
MLGQINITVSGNLTDEPQLRYTPTGIAVTTFSVATTERVKDPASGKYRDGETVYLRVDCWRGLAENVAESLSKGEPGHSDRDPPVPALGSGGRH